MGSRELIAKYDAIVSHVEFDNYAYWEVTYSVAPGMYRTITVCYAGIGPQEAVRLANTTLTVTTGQKVMQ